MRALMEAPCLRTAEVVDAMKQDAGQDIKRMSVDGGMTVNNLLMETQADFINAEIVRKEEKEITGIGVAIAAGLHTGVWPSLEHVESLIKVQKVFTPTMTEENRQKKRARWTQAVERSIGFGWAK